MKSDNHLIKIDNVVIINKILLEQLIRQTSTSRLEEPSPWVDLIKSWVWHSLTKKYYMLHKANYPLVCSRPR